MLLYNRKAFTMIELIFTIVIIGILSAIAVPKLMTTRASMRQRNFVGSTIYLCASRGSKAVVIITTSNDYDINQTVTLTQIISPNIISDLLSMNTIFQDFTHGTTGRVYAIGGSKIVH